MNKQLLLFCVLVFCFCPIVEAQLCSQVYEVEGLTSVHSVEQTMDGGYIIMGNILQKVVLIKTDLLGNELWRKIYSIGNQKSVRLIHENSDGTYYLIGRSYDGIAEIQAVFLMMINESGSVISEKTFEVETDNTLLDIKANFNNEIFVSGYSQTEDLFGEIVYEAILLKISIESGQIKKSKPFHTSDEQGGGGMWNYEHVESTASVVRLNNEGKAVLAGEGVFFEYDVDVGPYATIFYETSLEKLDWDFYNLDLYIDSESFNFYVVNDMLIDKKTNQPFFISYGFDFTERTIFFGKEAKFLPFIGQKFIQTTDNNFIVSGQEFEWTDIQWMKLDDKGNQIWMRTGVNPIDENTPFEQMKATNDGGFIVLWRGANAVHITKYDSNGYSCQNYLQGTILNDDNYNCELEEGEKAISDIKLKINEESFLTTVNPNGSYSLPLDSGSYNISISTTPDLWEANCEETYTVTFDELYQTIEGIDFALQPSIPCNLMNIDVGISRARACREGHLAIEYCNDGNMDAENIRIELQISPLLENLTSSTPFVEENGLYVFEPSILEWGRCRTIYVHYEVVCDAPFDEQVCVEAHIFPNDHCGEARPIDESITCLEVTNSYDPNDIQVEYEQPIEGGDCVVENGWLDYTIRFQNTGNDTAYRVMIMDSLPQSVELESFHRGASSHDYELEFHQPNVLVWIFDDINLLDSLNHEPESHGFVSFRIRQKSDNAEGLVIGNQAHIYFDFNPAIATNIAEVQNCLKTTLPVEITAFRGEVRGNGNFLQWHTASEINNDFYTLERSTDGKNFKEISKIKGLGTSTFSQTYTFLDRFLPIGTSYYRLSQTDLDATTRYLGTISLHREKSAVAAKLQIKRIYPVPTSDLLFVEFFNPSLQSLELGLVNTLGQVVLRWHIEGSASKVEVDCSELESGLYFLKIGDVWEKVVVR